MFYYPRVMGLQEQEICIDPKYQREGQDADKEGTYYPQGVVCYTDPSEGNKKIRLLDPLWLKGLMCVYLHLHNDFGKIKPHCVECSTRVYFLIHRARPDRAWRESWWSWCNAGPEPYN